MQAEKVKISANKRTSKDVAELTSKVMRGFIVVFNSAQEDRYINSSNAYLYVIDKFKDEITNRLDNGKDVEMFIRLEAMKKVTTDLLEAFNDYE